VLPDSEDETMLDLSLFDSKGEIIFMCAAVFC
jgi:hypothetical protein